MNNYQGSCHCGKVSFNFECPEIIKGLRCNCSICIRKGALMSSDVIPQKSLIIISGEDALSMYQFNTNVAKHYFCNICGIYPFHETMRMPGHFRINLGCVDGIDTFSLNTEEINGKEF